MIMMSEHRYGVHDCPNGFYYLRDVTDHSVYVDKNYGYLYSPYKEDIELVSALLNELADKVDEQQATISQLKEENKQLKEAKYEYKEDWKQASVNCDLYKQEIIFLKEEIKGLEEENEQLHHKLKQTKEYLQTKIAECKNPKKMKEIVFGVEQAKGYEKALLKFQKGLKRRLNDE